MGTCKVIWRKCVKAHIVAWLVKEISRTRKEYKLTEVITALTNSTTGLTANTMFGVVADLVPFIVMIVPVALGVYFLRKLVKGSGKAKVRF